MNLSVPSIGLFPCFLRLHPALPAVRLRRQLKAISISTTGKTFIFPSFASSSISHANKAFKTRYGCAVHDYVEKKRMQQALTLLGDKNRSLQNIAEALGYGNANYFSKAFKRVYGKTPSEYRTAQDG